MLVFCCELSTTFSLLSFCCGLLIPPPSPSANRVPASFTGAGFGVPGLDSGEALLPIGGRYLARLLPQWGWGSRGEETDLTVHFFAVAQSTVQLSTTIEIVVLL